MSDILDKIGRITTLASLIFFLWGIYKWWSGVFPVLLKLGHGLAGRKIAIFAKTDDLNSLKSLLLSSHIFQEKNIIPVIKEGDIKSAEDASVYLVYWPDTKNYLNKILGMKPDKCGLVIYAPYENKDKIPLRLMKEIDLHKNSSVTNFRGRLLNDIFTTMITSGYE